MAKVNEAETHEPEIYVARSSGIAKVDGVLHYYTKGRTRIRAGHPLLKAMPGAFSPMALDYERTTRTTRTRAG